MPRNARRKTDAHLATPSNKAGCGQFYVDAPRIVVRDLNAVTCAACQAMVKKQRQMVAGKKSEFAVTATYWFTITRVVRAYSEADARAQAEQSFASSHSLCAACERDLGDHPELDSARDFQVERVESWRERAR